MKTSKFATEVAELFLNYGVITFHTKNVIKRRSGISTMDFHIKKLFENSVGSVKFQELLIQFIDSHKVNQKWEKIIPINQSGTIPAWIIGQHLQLPILVRKHGTFNYESSLVVLDLISQGKTIKNIHTDVFACFSYDLYRRDNNFVLCDFHTVIDTALKKKYINEQEASSLYSWQKDPKKWVEEYLNMDLL